MKKVNITDIVLDFDGTCTEIPAIQASYLRQYLLELNKLVFSSSPLPENKWKEALGLVCNNSPQAGWTLASSPSAPAAADPYILAYESAKHLMRGGNVTEPPYQVHKGAYDLNPAPWRKDALKLFLELVEKGIRIHFISNSSTKMIMGRLQELWGEGNPLPDSISVHSDAAKFRICELQWQTQNEIPQSIKDQFITLPVSFAELSTKDLQRPVYLRRGAYFEAIYKVFGTDWSRLTSTVFCGDIWEMDLAMPYALGAHIHLITRVTPFNTYDYERKVILSCGDRAKISDELSGVLEWF